MNRRLLRREDRRNGPCLELRVCDRTPPRQTSSKSPFHRFSQHRLSSYLRCCFTSSLDEAESANMRTASLSRCVVCSEFAPCRLYSELVQSALQLGKGVPQAFASTQVGHLPRRGPQTVATGQLGDLWMLRLIAGLGFVLILSLTLRIAGIEAQTCGRTCFQPNPSSSLGTLLGLNRFHDWCGRRGAASVLCDPSPSRLRCCASLSCGACVR